MYAVTFEIDTETLQQSYPGDSWRNAYVEIRRILNEDELSMGPGEAAAATVFQPEADSHTAKEAVE